MIPLAQHGSLSASDLLIESQGVIQKVAGSDQALILGVSDSKTPGPHTLVFVSEEADLAPSLQSATVIVVDEKLMELSPTLSNADNQSLFLTKSLRMAMARLLRLFDRPALHPSIGIHPSAVIHPTAIISDGVVIEAHVFVGEKAVIGKSCWIQAGAIVEDHASIGEKTRIQSNAVIGRFCKIGQRCQIGPATVIGSDGFGFTDNQKSLAAKIPQISHVEIGDDVEFGAHCAVDRGTLKPTIIRSGCKFDNFCHVAHNCELGPFGLYAGGFFVAGSSKIGAHFMCGGTVAVADHVSITNNVILGGRATVTKDITEPGAYTGYPLQKIKDGLRTISSLPSVPELRTRIEVLEAELEKLKSKG